MWESHLRIPRLLLLDEASASEGPANAAKVTLFGGQRPSHRARK